MVINESCNTEQKTLYLSMSRLKALSPAFCAVINESARKIFGNLPIVNYRTGFKYLRHKPRGPIATSYYMDDNEAPFRAIQPGFKTEIEERRDLALKMLRRRGKGPPKKGQGKRAMKKKK